MGSIIHITLRDASFIELPLVGRCKAIDQAASIMDAGAVDAQRAVLPLEDDRHRIIGRGRVPPEELPGNVWRVPRVPALSAQASEQLARLV
jgi:hypothetical protein